MKSIVLFAILFISLFSYSQPTPNYTSSQILHQIQRLNTAGSVLYIAAHPDDENTRLISYLTNGLHLRTGYLSLTRGDGGQNLIGTEQGAALGLLRTQELIAARRADGAEQFFTRANDFGYSKNPEETLSIWEKESILADVVWVIRNFKPDVIICRFPTTGEGGHGHHTTSAILAEEAFDAAADPTRFPEQLDFTTVWQTRRMFWNTFNFGGNNTTAPDQLKLDVGGYNSLLGKSYGEIASASRTMHKSQGFGVPMQRGEEIEYFKFIKGDFQPKEDLFEGIDFTWNRFDETKKLPKILDKIIQKFDVQHPEKSIVALKQVANTLNDIRYRNYGNNQKSALKRMAVYKHQACQEIMLNCAGIWLETFAQDYAVVPGDSLVVTTQIICRNPSNATVLSPFNFENSTSKQAGQKTIKLPINQLMTFHDTIAILPQTTYSEPYWLKNAHDVAMYQIDDQLSIGNPENSPLKARFYLFVEGEFLQIMRPIVYKQNDPVRGEVYRPLEILPPATVNLSSDVVIFGNNQSQPVEFKMVANRDNVTGSLNTNLPEGWSLEMPTKTFQLAKKHDEIILKGKLIPSETPGTDYLKASLLIDGKVYQKSITRIEYEHIPYQFFLQDANAKIVRLDLKKGGENIAYIPGAGDKVAELLAQVGYRVTLLSNDDLDKMDLSQFDAIVTGVRAFNVNPKLIALHDKFMKYVENGGNFIVQYNTNNRIAPLNDPIGPYPFKITTKRVTDENAQVNFSNPKATILNQPNSITAADFEDWIQERGLYFADEIDANYETVFTMNDRGEQPLEGSLIIGQYGKGHFVYTGLSFFRELPAGIPGAYRLFANLLGL